MSTKQSSANQAFPHQDAEPALANQVRIEHFDESGQSAFVEYQTRAAFNAAQNAQPVQAGKVALLTGIGKGGIGEATARKLAADGCHVIACDRDEIGDETCQAIRRDGGRADFVLADVSTPNGIEGFLDQVEDRAAGRVDLLVNNAGSAGDPRVDNVNDLTGEGFRRLINDNLIGPFHVTTEVLRRFMLPRKTGVVVFLGTHNGQLGSGRSDN